MRISNLDYINNLTEENSIQGGALIPETPYSNFLDFTLSNLSEKFSSFRTSDLSSVNTGGDNSFSSLFSNIQARLGSGGSVSNSTNIDLTSPTQGIVIRREAPISS